MRRSRTCESSIMLSWSARLASARVPCQRHCPGNGDGLPRSFGAVAQQPCGIQFLLLNAKDRDIIFIDEIHEMKRDYQTALYLALDKQRIFIKTGNGAPQGIPVGNFSLLLATTDEYSILQPLRDRMKLLLRYEFYSDEELAQVLRHRSKALAGQSMKPCCRRSHSGHVALHAWRCDCFNPAIVLLAPSAKATSCSNICSRAM